ncbi:MAG TPA: thioredoxin family protein [Campylobacterales bacterium]|nr:thioredoxin family protein [Campylobacterales bacterium]
MKSLIMVSFLTLFLYGDGESIYKEKCASCHQGFIPMGQLKENFVEFNNTKLQLKGPTLNQLSFRLKQNIGDPRGDEDIHLMEVQEFVKAYVINPDIQKSVCMDEVLAAFETMPSMKGQVSEEELEEVAEYMYHFDKNSLEEHSPEYVDFDKALKKAKIENKIIMIKGTSEHCHFCKKMDREVFSENEVMDVLKKEFISVEIDIYKEKLPLNLNYKVTPTYFFIDSDGKSLKKVPGSWDKNDFLEILSEVKNLKKGSKK